MSARLPCPPAPGPLEAYAAQFDAVFTRLAQRHQFRVYLTGLLLPRDRNKTLTGLAGAEPIVQAQEPAVQRLQGFLSESSWDADALNDRRLALLLGDGATAPTSDGVLIIDDSGDRKDGSHTDHVARQYLGSVGKVDNGVVVVTSLWANADRYDPLDLCPYTPASRLPKGKSDPAFKTKPQIAQDLIRRARAAGIPFRAIVADCFYGDNIEFEETLHATGLPYVVAVKPAKGHWAPLEEPHTPEEAAELLAWTSAQQPGDWTAVVRQFRDGHQETWWAAELQFAHSGPDRTRRMVVVTTDPATLPRLSSWYLVTNLPVPGSPRAIEAGLPAADLAEVTGLYGLRIWVEQGYKQQKDQLGWADYQVRSDRAMRHHWQLVVCAFTFCWEHWFHPASPVPGESSSAEWGKKGADRWLGEGNAAIVLAARAASSAELADPLVGAPAGLGRVVRQHASRRIPDAPRRHRPRTANLPVSPPIATNYRY